MHSVGDHTYQTGHPNTRRVTGHEAGDGALGAAAGRLLNAPGTAAHGGAVEVQALVDELAKRLQSNAGASKDGERSLGLASDRPAPWRSRRLSVFLAIASVAGSAASVGVLALVLLRLPSSVVVAPSAAVEPSQVVTVEEDPLSAILVQVRVDNFGAANSLWDEKRREAASGEHHQRLSYDDSMIIGRACLRRAKELASTSPERATAATDMAHQIAMFVRTEARDEATKRAGNQLREAVVEFRRGRLPADDDATSG